MPSYSCDPGLEVTGTVAQKLFATLNRDQVMPFLKVHHLVDIDPDGWVRLLDVLKVMNDLAWLGGVTGNFVATGIHVAEISQLPSEIETASLVEFWDAFNVFYQQATATVIRAQL